MIPIQTVRLERRVEIRAVPNHVLDPIDRGVQCGSGQVQEDIRSPPSVFRVAKSANNKRVTKNRFPPDHRGSPRVEQDTSDRIVEDVHAQLVEIDLDPESVFHDEPHVVVLIGVERKPD